LKLKFKRKCVILTTLVAFGVLNQSGENMTISYNKLWKILINRNISKTLLMKAAKISTHAMAKMSNNRDVRVEILVKICAAPEYSVDDIMEIVPIAK